MHLVCTRETGRSIRSEAICQGWQSGCHLVLKTSMPSRARRFKSGPWRMPRSHNGIALDCYSRLVRASGFNSLPWRMEVRPNWRGMRLQLVRYGFESHHFLYATVAQVAEHFLGTEEVRGARPCGCLRCYSLTRESRGFVNLRFPVRFRVAAFAVEALLVKHRSRKPAQGGSIPSFGFITKHLNTLISLKSQMVNKLYLLGCQIGRGYYR